MNSSKAVVGSSPDRFERLLARRYSRFTAESYRCVARAFLRFLASRRVGLTAARPSDVEAFLKARRAAYRRARGREPADVSGWRTHYTSPVRMLLRIAQGEWPPSTPSSRQIASYRLSLQHQHRTPQTVSAYRIVSQRFLSFLEERGTSPEKARPTDVDAFLKYELSQYRRRHGRDPKDLVGWRCSLTPPIHDLLRHVQGEWPPSFRDPWFGRFTAHMVATCRKPKTRGHYLHAVRQFQLHLRGIGVAVEMVEPAHVEAYVRGKLDDYRSRHRRDPIDVARWRWSCTVPIHRLLRLVHGDWPPRPTPDPLVERLSGPLEAQGYSRWRRSEMDRVARQFIAFLRDRGVTPEQAQPAHVESFITARLERYRRRHGHEPPHPQAWRARFVAPVHRLLRLAQAQWPPSSAAEVTPLARFSVQLRDGFRHWMIEVRGLSELSFTKDSYTAARLLEWLGERASAEELRQLSPSDLDAFLAWRTAGLRRATRCGTCSGLRSFLRYLRAAGWIDRDLASCVSSPSRYWNESIPSAFTEAQVKAMLASTRRDRGRAGRRDYAILMLLATYGLRAGEITRLRLSDIDWRRERFRVTQSKTKRSSYLPLTSAVGEAILDYLRHDRPESVHREVFLRANAPFSPFARGSSLTTVVGRRMQRAGVTATGKHGAHAFRYARAVGLLRAAVPLKTISDLLGHSTSAATEIYLKLDTDELCEVALDVPEEVAP